MKIAFFAGYLLICLGMFLVSSCALETSADFPELPTDSKTPVAAEPANPADPASTITTSSPQVIQSSESITAQTADQITQLGRLKVGAIADIAWSPDGSMLAVATGASIQLFESKTLVGQVEMEAAEEITSIAIAPDGKTVASGNKDGLIELWDSSTGERVDLLEELTGRIWALGFSADGKKLASGSEFGAIYTWILDTGEPVVMNGGITGQGMHAEVYCLVFTPDNQSLVSGSWDEISSWDVSTGFIQRTFYWSMEYVYTLAFSPDGTTLASGNNLHTILLWDWQTGQLLRTLEGHTGPVLDVAFSPDGRLLASASRDGIRLWEMSSGNLLRVLNGHSDITSRVVFSPDGKLLASVGWDGDVVLWGVR